jgi:CubicO group peptidase (beta-lactamase class C family)
MGSIVEGMSTADREAVRSAVRAGVASGVTPGASLVYGDGDREVDRFAVGQTQTRPPEGARPIDSETRFDVASVTKVAATTAVFLRLIERGAIGLDDPLRRWIPEATVSGADRIRLRHLAGHASGYPAHVEFFRDLLAGEWCGAADPRDAMLRLVATTPLAYETGTQAIYSDLGMILLGFSLERAAGQRLDQLTRELVTEPLGMTATGFVDLLADPPAPRPHPVAATEICPYRGLVVGEVHDDNCHAAGGILGHAGLFSTPPDLARYAVAINRAARGEAGLFDPALVSHFATTSEAPNTTRAIGFDRPSPEPLVSHAGELWPRDGFGHTGFTGCSVWMDPPRGRYAVFLSNRVHPTRTKRGILEVRRSVMDAIVTALSAR